MAALLYTAWHPSLNPHLDFYPLPSSAPFTLATCGLIAAAFGLGWRTVGRRVGTARLGGGLHDDYPASECMVMAFDCGQGWLHVNSDWVILERVGADYRPTPAWRAVAHRAADQPATGHAGRAGLGPCMLEPRRVPRRSRPWQASTSPARLRGRKMA